MWLNQGKLGCFKKKSVFYVKSAICACKIMPRRYICKALEELLITSTQCVAYFRASNFETGVFKMSRVCHFTGRRTVAGRSICRHGKPKYLGGIGLNITGVNKRKFKPNIQKVRAIVDGKICKIKVSAKAIKMGLVVKPPKRNWKPAQQAAE
jgi:large subunit ribosomal protein L28